MHQFDVLVQECFENALDVGLVFRGMRPLSPPQSCPAWLRVREHPMSTAGVNGLGAAKPLTLWPEWVPLNTSPASRSAGVRLLRISMGFVMYNLLTWSVLDAPGCMV
ncbi:MAG: hypothetical protein LBC94_04395 [Desulfovibrio sp.]|nr:hypothetical protein [Desulfovibrio sp.]